MKADKIYINGNIFTVNENDDWAEAVAIRGNEIIYVGDNAGVQIFRALSLRSISSGGMEH